VGKIPRLKRGGDATAPERNPRDAFAIKKKKFQARERFEEKTASP